MKRIGPSKSGETTPEMSSDLVSMLSQKANLFLFSYALTEKTLISWSDNAEKILGVKDIAIARDGNLFLRHVHPDDRFALMTELERGLRGETPYRSTYRWIRPDTNETRWLHCRATLNTVGKDKIFEGLIVDLSEEFTGEMSRMAGPDSVQSVLAALPTLVFTVDRDLRLLRINRPSGDTSFNFGDEKFNFADLKIGRTVFDLLSDDELANDYKRTCRHILDGRFPHHRRRIALEDTVFTLEMTPLTFQDVVQGILFIVSDISEVVRLERDMSELQRAEGLRLLAAGVAHNFNNALQGILGYAAILTHHADNKEFVLKAGAAINDLVLRASDLTKQLLAYEQDSGDSTAPLDINTVAMAAINAVEDLFTSGVKVSVTFGNPEKVKAQRTAITEAIIAILRNAKEAIIQQPSKSKNLAIKTSEVHLSDLEVADLPSGAYAKLSITDSGSGMEQAALKRCFEPFFTTKERDAATGVGIKPSGLGLPKAFSIIRGNGGIVQIESAKAVGTTVAIYLPVENSTALSSTKVTPLRRRNPDILIIDDDHMVLSTVQNMINDLGFTCITADDPAQAYNQLKQHSRSIKLVLLDAVMPATDGATILRGLKKINADIKVIGFSGATPQQTFPMLKEGAITILRKPVSQEELKDVISTYLNTPNAPKHQSR